MKTTIMLKATIYVDVNKEVTLEDALKLDPNDLLSRELCGVLGKIVDWENVEVVGLIKQDE